MAQLYKYTTYLTDGTKKVSKPRPKMSLKELQEAIGGYIEIVPRDYYKHQKWGRVTVYVDEDGRWKRPRPAVNPFFVELSLGYNIVGIALKEQIYHG